MHWIILLLAGLCEVVWAVGLKISDGFTRFWPSVWTVAAMIASFVLLCAAMKKIPLGTAYAVWTGIGAAGTVLAGILMFGESRDLPRLLFIGLILAGIIGLKATHAG